MWLSCQLQHWQHVQVKLLDSALSTGGSDDTVVPEQGRTIFVQQLKSSRDAMEQALETAYQAISPYISSSSDDE